VPYTSTLALTNVTALYADEIARVGVERAIEQNAALARGVNTWDRRCTHAAVASAAGVPFTPLPVAARH
jgi:alanine dehydrogenase